MDTVRVVGILISWEETMSDLTDAELEAMEKRPWSDGLIWEAVARGWCSNENAHKEMDVTLGEAIAVEVQTLVREHFSNLPALIAALREARGERKQEIHLVFDGPPEHVAGRFVEAENSAGESISVGRWEQRGEYWHLIIPRAAEVERVKRLEAESEAARAFRNEYRKDFGAWKDLRDDLFRLLDESDEDAALAELDAGEGPC